MCMQMKIKGLRACAKVPAWSIGAKNIGSLKNQFEVGVTLKGIYNSCIYGEMGGGEITFLHDLLWNTKLILALEAG